MMMTMILISSVWSVDSTNRPEDDEVARLVTLTNHVLRVCVWLAGFRAANVDALEAWQTHADLVA